MMDVQEMIGRLRANAEIIRTLVQPVSDEQANWKPDSQTWSLRETMEHVYNEERIDFRQHLMEMLSDPPLAWGALDGEGYLIVKDCRRALELFLKEREDSLVWLQGLGETDWTVKQDVTYDSVPEIYTHSAGDVLVSWVAHDFLHLRQMNELLYAWNVHQASPYSVRYAGEW
ncbi:MAG TPA: DinB family protein [Anaerolinea sp.]|nr:DinB family protein [Anaerolinea sp.]